MNLARWGLDRRPFRPTPALDLFVALPPHEAAVAALRSAFAAGDGLALLDGGPGTGKTQLALRFLESLGGDVLPIFVPSARFAKPADLHQAILFDLGQPYRGLGEQELRLAVTEQLLAALAEKKRAVLVLDESQHLSADLLEEVRLLDNWEARGTKVLFTLLVALADLRERLHEPLAQRVRCRLRLEPLSQEDSLTFLRTQLEQCGRNADEIINEEALRLFARHGRGVPRVLNQLAASALQLAADGEAEGVDVEVAFEVLSQAGVEIAEAEEPARPAYPAGAARSVAGEDRERGEGREPGAAKTPKQKSRTRRAA
jgi:type II secretory pathway predicted ATPase ExeA